MRFSNQYFVWLFTFLLLLSGNIWSYSSPVAFQQSEALKVAKQNLPSEGMLQQSSDGYVYVKVTDDYVRYLFPLIQQPGFDIPSAVKRHTKIGAHISIFYENEAKAIGPIPEIGQLFSFEPESIQMIRSGRKEYIILQVTAPQLENLRQHYGLSSKLLDHEFHITLAEKHLYSSKKH